MAASDAAGEKLKVFVSYSRADIGFADQLVMALEDKGFDPILDRHDIDSGEKWKERLGALIFGADTVVFVLTETSAASPICAWEVDEAVRLGKRTIPIVPRPVEGVKPPPALGDLNWIHFFETPAIPSSGFYDGVKKLDRALRVDLSWLREQTRLSEQAAQWAKLRADDLLLRGVALEEAVAWQARQPASVEVQPLLREYLVASETAAETRKAEASAQIAERESALKEKEEALGARTRADRLARRATLVGIVVAGLLVVLSGWLGWAGAKAIHAASKYQSVVLADESQVRAARGQHAEAILVALAGDPAARRSLTERFLLAREGYVDARLALAAAYRTAPERVFGGHSGEVEAVAVSPDGKQVLTGDNGGAKLWDVHTGRILRTFEADGVRSVAFLKNSDLVLALGYDGAQLWEVGTGRLVRTLTTDASIGAISPDGTLVLTGSSNGAFLWEARTGRALRAFGVGDPILRKSNQLYEDFGLGPRGEVTAVAFSRDGTRVVAAGPYRVTRMWDTATGRALRSLGQSDEALGFSEDGSVLAAGSRGLQVWTPEAGRARDGPPVQGGSPIAISPDGMGLLHGRYDGVVELWDIKGNRFDRAFGGNGESINAVAFSPDGKRILTGSKDGIARLWAVDIPPASRVVLKHEGTARRTFLSANGKRALVETEGASILWDLDGGRALHTLQGFSAVGLSPDGGRILTAPTDARTLAQQLADGDGARTAIGTQIRDASDGSVLRTLKGAYGRMAFSPSGNRILSGSRDDTAQLWDVETGAPVRSLVGHRDFVASVAFSPNGRRVLTGSADNTARLWDAETGRTLRTLSGHSGRVKVVAFSLDGRRVVTGSDDETARVWDAETGFALQAFRAERRLGDTAISPDGKLVLTSSGRGAMLWDVGTGRQLQEFAVGGEAYISSVWFSQDGKKVLTDTRDGTLRVWSIDPVFFAPADAQVRLGCAKLRGLGATRYTDEILQRFPFLQSEPRDPCLGVR